MGEISSAQLKGGTAPVGPLLHCRATVSNLVADLGGEAEVAIIGRVELVDELLYVVHVGRTVGSFADDFVLLEGEGEDAGKSQHEENRDEVLHDLPGVMMNLKW